MSDTNGTDAAIAVAVVLAVAFAWVWIYASGETARRNRAIYRDVYPDYRGGYHL